MIKTGAFGSRCCTNLSILSWIVLQIDNRGGTRFVSCDGPKLGRHNGNPHSHNPSLPSSAFANMTLRRTSAPARISSGAVYSRTL